MGDEEGMDFEAAFLRSVGPVADFGKNTDTEKRLKAERKAGQTAKQRGKKTVPKMQINFRATAETKAQLAALSKLLDLSVTDVVGMAIAEFTKSHLKSGAKKA